MTVDVARRGGGGMNFSNWFWRALLYLATDYGWRPAGTRAPLIWDEDQKRHRPWEEMCPATHWSGDYTGNAGQVAGAADAVALADALDRALADKEETPAHPKTRAFIVFCRHGEFINF